MYNNYYPCGYQRYLINDYYCPNNQGYIDNGTEQARIVAVNFDIASAEPIVFNVLFKASECKRILDHTSNVCWTTDLVSGQLYTYKFNPNTTNREIVIITPLSECTARVPLSMSSYFEFKISKMLTQMNCKENVYYG
jgi:hypothetical protein